MPSAPISSAPVSSLRLPSARSTSAVTVPSALPAIAGHPLAQPHRIGAGAGDEDVVQEHVELAAMHGVLLPVVAGELAARLGIDVVAVQPDQRPFPGRQPDAVERRLADAEIVEFAHRIGLQVDADAERPHLAHLLEDQRRAPRSGAASAPAASPPMPPPAINTRLSVMRLRPIPSSRRGW